MAERFKILKDYVRDNWCESILEIGVLKGDTASLLMTHSQNKDVRYVGIDLFENLTPEILEKEGALQPDSLETVKRKLKLITRKKQIVQLYKGFSRDILPQLVVNNEKFDMIFIDGGHSLETLRNDFAQSVKLIKDEGTIFIDDYTDEDYMKDVKYFCDNDLKKYRLVFIVRDERDNYRGYDYKIVEVKAKAQTIYPVDLLTSFNRDFLKIFEECFLETLPLNTNLYVRYIKGEVDKRFGVFYQKMEFVKNHLKNNKNLIFFCDADVVFLLNNVWEDLYQLYFDLEEPDLLMQWNQEEGQEKNIGVMLIKPSKRVYELYSKYCEADSDWIIENYGFDQKYFNYLLETEFKDLRVKTLPLRYYGGQMIEYKVAKPDEQLVLYHATFEKDNVAKYQTLQNYKNLYI